MVIPTHNRRAPLLRCLHSVHRGAGAASAVYVVDDGCQDGTADAVRTEYPAVDLIVGDGSLWWSGAMNLGARTAIRDGAKWILVLNDDTELAPDAVTHLIRRSEANPDAIVGSKVLTRQTGTIWSAGGVQRWPWPGLIMRGYGEPDCGQYDAPAEVSWLPGMGTLIRAEHMQELGYYDAVHLPQYYADADLTLRARNMGLRVLYEPASRVINDTSTTGLSVRTTRTLLSFLRTFTERRSQRHLPSTLRFYARHCPLPWLPVTISWLYARHLAAWLRHGRGTHQAGQG